jgi:hypothetical protein
VRRSSEEQKCGITLCGSKCGITLCGSAASGPIVEPAINCWRQIIFFCSPTNQRDRFRAGLGSRAADIAVPMERPLSAHVSHCRSL